jgi:hypothetical protein
MFTRHTQESNFGISQREDLVCHVLWVNVQRVFRSIEKQNHSTFGQILDVCHWTTWDSPVWMPIDVMIMRLLTIDICAHQNDA